MAKQKRKPSSCQKKKDGKKCEGKYKLTYENNAPIFTCDKCDNIDLTWKKFYNEYLQLFKIKENWDNEKDKVSCIIGFFCYMYKNNYDVDYIFVPQNPNPYSSKECRDAWRLLSAFNGDAHAVRKYIYWFFKNIIRSTTNIVSFAYINTPGIIRKYNIYNKKKAKITRSSNLPSKFIEWCSDNIPDIFNNYELTTINDLGALLSHVKFYGADDQIETRAIKKAEEFGLIKDDKLNIRE